MIIVNRASQKASILKNLQGSLNFASDPTAIFATGSQMPLAAKLGGNCSRQSKAHEAVNLMLTPQSHVEKQGEIEFRREK